MSLREKRLAQKATKQALRLTAGLIRYDHLDEAVRLQRAMSVRGYIITLREAEAIWMDYSDDYAAGWMGMPESDHDLFATALPYLASHPFKVR